MEAPSLSQKLSDIADKKVSKEEREKLRRKERKLKQKDRKKQKKSSSTVQAPEDDEASYSKNINSTLNNNEDGDDQGNEKVEVEYVERDEFLLTGQYYDCFKSVFQYFSAPKSSDKRPRETDSDDEDDEDGDPKQGDKPKTHEKGQKGENPEDNKPLSRKKKKLLKRMKVAQLKALVKRPDVVEAWDVTAPDPLLLVHLKSYRNSVAVPRHWCQKRKFLQNKRGILKPAFKLPEFIEATGIARLRDPFNEKDAGKMVKQKLKEKMNPKMGKIDIDYEVLHDAFFKNQLKSKMTTHGDIYYEGKEDEVKMRSYKPGKLSEELRQALGISEFTPPPWIINMQRYGPPPSYPNLKITGLNAVIPDSNYDRGLYGKGFDDEPQIISNALWGEYADDEDDENVEDAEGAHIDNDAANVPDFKAEVEGKSGTTSIISGIETPDIDIRKQPSSFGVVKQPNLHDVSDKQLYQILEPVQKNIGANIFGSTHGYIIPGLNDQGKNIPHHNDESDKKGKAEEQKKPNEKYRF